MEKMDPQTTARVWQRVQGQSGIDSGQLQALILEESMTGICWQRLWKTAEKQNKALLAQLYSQSRERCACLRGIYRLLTGSKLSRQSLQLPQEGALALLRANYGRLMHCLVRYEAWQTEPEYGAVFTQLVVQTREQCRRALQLLGAEKQQ